MTLRGEVPGPELGDGNKADFSPPSEGELSKVDKAIKKADLRHEHSRGTVPDEALIDMSEEEIWALAAAEEMNWKGDFGPSAPGGPGVSKEAIVNGARQMLARKEELSKEPSE